MTITTTARSSWAWVTLSSVAVAAYFVGQYAQGSLDSLARAHTGLAATYAARPWPIQVAFYLHIVLAGLALALGPWQFAKRIRVRHIRIHRAIGRIYLIAVLVGGVAALVMAPFNSAGMVGFFGFGALAVLWPWTAWRAFRAVRDRDIASHQAWMIRCFALTYAAVTLRLEFAALILIQLPFAGPDADFAALSANAYAPLAFLAWLPNLVIAEFMVRRRGLPALYLTTRPIPTV
ncbi:DUF2306 domain-containing protein [Nocardia pseudobrasiliensis]|uniref:Putative membrane protein n=1 Tax=Nocardia pseudobrasiliensis TaxID=45979 RepID=A0A370IBT2_9NOCA|nr:DUF2306 domain-containing protein [Nocardia pseudobrasiliensis]RDI68182.1 putative membrane protein [Nocardia pseudobrasiliensis]